MTNRTKNDKNQTFTIYLYITISYICIMRLKSIILSELGAEHLKVTQRIEDAMNSTSTIDEKCNIIKSQLRELATLNQMMDIWRTITVPDTKIFEQPEQE